MGILFAEMMDITESKKWTQTDTGGRMSLLQCIFDNDSVFLCDKNRLSCQDYPPYPVDEFGHLINRKITNIFVPFGIIFTPFILVNTQVELCFLLNHCLIHG